MKSIFSRIEERFFENGTSLNLASVRFFFFIFICFCLLFRMSLWPAFANHSPLFFKPTGVLFFLESLNLSFDVYQAIYYIAVASCFFSAIGLLGRFSLVTAFLSFALINGLAQFYQALVALNTASTFILFIFCFSEAHKYYSFSSLLARRPKTEVISSEMGWPIFYFKVVHVTFIFMSGLTKLWESGFAWVSSNNLLNHVLCSPLVRADRSSEEIISWGLGFKISQFEYLMNFSAFSVLALELLFPLALVCRRLEKPLISLFFVFQISSVFFLFVDPTLSIGLFLIWIDWSKRFNSIKSFFDKKKILVRFKSLE